MTPNARSAPPSAPCGGARPATGPPALRIGVETGPAVLGPIGGGGQGRVRRAGRCRRRGAALQSPARPGSALVGPVTRAAAEPPVHLGHRSGARSRAPSRWSPTAAWAARRAATAGRAPARPAARWWAGRPSWPCSTRPCARRSRGHGSLVVLTGEPGLGKTRLVQECRERFMAWAGPARPAAAVAGGPLRLLRLGHPVRPLPAAAGRLGRAWRPTSPRRSCAPPWNGRWPRGRQHATCSRCWRA